MRLVAARYALGLYSPRDRTLVVADTAVFQLSSHVRSLLPGATGAAAPETTANRRSVRDCGDGQSGRKGGLAR